MTKVKINFPFLCVQISFLILFAACDPKVRSFNTSSRGSSNDSFNDISNNSAGTTFPVTASEPAPNSPPLSVNALSPSIESNYNYIGVVQNNSGTLTLTFSINAGTATNFRMASLPTNWTYQSGDGTCSTITPSNSCVITLVYQPTTVDATATTVSLPYSYIENNSFLTGSVTFQAQGLDRKKWSVALPGTIQDLALHSYYYDFIVVWLVDTAYAFNASDGSLVWSNTVPGDIGSGALDGSLIWSYAAEGKIPFSPIWSSDGSTVYVVAPDDNSLYALNNETVIKH